MKTLTFVALLACVVFSTTVSVRAGERRVGDTAGGGELKTKVKPANTGVWIDGEYVGHVDRFSGPGEHLFLPAGEHKVKLTRVFYESYETTVSIKEGEETVLRHKMAPNGDKPAPGPYGRIKIQPEPELNVGLIVDGHHVGYADQVNKIAQTLLLTPGKHEIELVYEGYKPYKTTIEVEAGKKQILTPKMEKK